MGVRNKPQISVKAGWHWRSTLAAAAGAACLICAMVLYYAWPSLSASTTITVSESGISRVIKVPNGGSIQTALEKAASGDVIELQSGGTYYGPIKLPVKDLKDFVTIRSSDSALLPEDKRVGPNDRAKMARILTRSEQPAVSAENGAHHYRFVGIEFAPSTETYVYNLVLFGNGEAAGDLPHDLEIDRSYLHPFNKGTVRRAIALNSASTNIKNSYIEGFGFPSEETQGICGWTGSRNIKIWNNYIEGGAENIMFGGSDPSSADLVPTDIEIRGNHLNKPREWIGKATMKTLFELKNAKRVRFVENLLTNNWVGSAFRITVRNQDGGAPFSTVEDVTIKDNFIDNSGDGITILGKDDTHPSMSLKRLVIENNVLINIGSQKGAEGSGYFIQVADGGDITILNNTSLNSGNIVTLYGTMPTGLVFRDNFAGHGNYGIHSEADLRSAAMRNAFQNNVFINLNAVPASDFSFPPGNQMISNVRDAGFVNAATQDYRLAPSSRFRGKGKAGKDIGSSLDPALVNRAR